MAHEIETRTDGRAAFVASRRPAWHDLGHVADADLTVTEALSLGHLAGWDVHKRPAVALADDGTPITLADRVMTVRTNPFTGDLEGLGVVGADYTVWQNEELAAFGEAIADEGLIVDAAGSLFGGRRVFITFRAPETIVVPGTEDAIEQFLVLASSHDGSLAVTGQVTSIRVVCANTLGAMLGQDTAQRFRALHLGAGPAGRVQDARQALGVVFASGQALAAETARWAAAELVPASFDSIVAGLFPEAAADADVTPWARTKAQQGAEQVRDLYENAATQANVRGTAWAALNAYTEWLEWIAPAQRDTRAMAQTRFVGETLPVKRLAAAKLIRAQVPALTGRA